MIEVCDRCSEPFDEDDVGLTCQCGRTRPYRVWQDDEGNWCVSSPKFPTSWTVGKTLEEAMKANSLFIADYEQMVQHHDGECPPECRWCKDYPQTKGALKEKASVPA